MYRNSTRENRETPLPPAASKEAGRWEKAMSYKTHMYGGGESYSGVVPAKQPNKGGRPSAEGVEGRPLTEENTGQTNQRRTPRRESGPSGLDRVRKAAKKKGGKVRFTALLHHVSVDRLRDSYHSLKKKAAPGVDGVTWQEYGEGLEARLSGLHGRIHSGGVSSATVEANMDPVRRWAAT